jgi:hypothetical protein
MDFSTQETEHPLHICVRLLAQPDRDLAQHLHERRCQRRCVEVQEGARPANPILREETQRTESTPVQADVYRQSAGCLTYSLFKERDYRWISQYTGKGLLFDVYSGHDFPEDLEQYRLVVHCGACTINRRQMLRRIRECKCRGVHVSSHGIAISKAQGVLNRVIAPFTT